MASRFTRGLLSLILGAGVLAVIATSPANAYPPGASCTNSGSEHGGHWRTSAAAAITGVAATLNMPANIGICSTDQSATNLTASGVQIVTPAGGRMEVGYKFYGGTSCVHGYATYTQGGQTSGGVTNTLPGCLSVGPHAYRVFYDTTCTCERMQIDNTIVATTPYNPAGTYPWNSNVWNAGMTSYVMDMQTDLTGHTATPQAYTGIVMNVGWPTIQPWNDACNLPQATFAYGDTDRNSFSSDYSGVGTHCDSAETWSQYVLHA